MDHLILTMEEQDGRVVAGLEVKSNRLIKRNETVNMTDIRSL